MKFRIWLALSISILFGGTLIFASHFTDTPADSAPLPSIKVHHRNPTVTDKSQDVLIKPVCLDTPSPPSLTTTEPPEPPLNAVEIVRVQEGSNAALNGIVLSDLVTAYNGHTIADTQTLIKLVNETSPSQYVDIEVYRDNRFHSLAVRGGLLGVNVQNYSKKPNLTSHQ